MKVFYTTVKIWIYVFPDDPGCNPDTTSTIFLLTIPFFFKVSNNLLIETCHAWKVKCLAQWHISRTHDCWWTQRLQTCNHLIIAILFPPLINYVSCENQDWCQSRSSCAQRLKNSEMKTPIVQRQTIANFTLAKAGILYNLGDPPKKPQSRQTTQIVWDDLDKSVLNKRQEGGKNREDGRKQNGGSHSYEISLVIHLIRCTDKAKKCFYFLLLL